MGVSVKLGMSAVNLTEFFSVIEESERLGDSDSTGVAPRFSVPREGFLILGWRNTYGTHWFDRERVGEGISAAIPTEVRPDSNCVKFIYKYVKYRRKTDFQD